MTWPTYSMACRSAVDDLLRKGGSLSAYRANKDYGAEPRLDSWACRLERQLERRMGVKYAVAVNSGTAALHAALVSLLPNGDRGDIITSPYTFSATASAIILAGYKPVFADIDPETFCITKETVKRVVCKRTRGIVPVSLFGNLCDVAELQSFGLPVIEDACQSVGAGPVGKPLARAFSFNGGKNIPAGECGALLTDSSRVAEEARYLSNHGENFGREAVGYNYRPNEVTACIAYHGLMELNENNRERILLAEALTGYIKAEPKLKRFIEIPDSVKFDGSHVFYVYPFKLKGIRRSLFAKRMIAAGFHVGQGYITPALHKYPAFKKYCKRSLPVVEELSSESLCIFSHVTPGATFLDMQKTVDAMVQSTRLIR